MKLLCITYRKWAIEIYETLENMFPEYSFKIIKSREEYKKDLIDEFKPDMILWYGWSWIIENDIINNYFCVMLHPSPLPKYRGGSPIQNQIINGEKFSSITLFKMTENLDAGPIIIQLSFSLLGDITDIFKRLIILGVAASEKLINGNYSLTEQNENDATIYNRLSEDNSEITIDDLLNLSAETLCNKIRMLTPPYPPAYILMKGGVKLKILKAEIEGIDGIV